MSSVVFSSQSAQALAGSYLAEHHPTSLLSQVRLLALGEVWLVEAHLSPKNGTEPPRRALLMVNRHGFVEDLGAATTRAPGGEGPCLSGMRKVNDVIDLRGSERRPVPADTEKRALSWWG